MASLNLKSLFVVLILALTSCFVIPTHSQLTPNFYHRRCPQALPMIRNVVRRAIRNEPRMGASLLRLHFHDCFVNGCDGSILLDDNPPFIGEKTAIPNNNSVRGFDVVDEIKATVDRACKRPVVSCADILAIAARDSVTILGGQQFDYPVLLGRRDAKTASIDAANNNLPSPFSDLPELVAKFDSHGLNLQDLVVLSGGHTIGQATCGIFRDRLYNDTNIDPSFQASLKSATCPMTGGDTNLAPIDATPDRVDTNYYGGLIRNKGLLHSDQELFKGDGSESDRLVKLYSEDMSAFARDFAASMIKMGNLKPLTGDEGEIRVNCRQVNN